MRRIRPFGFQEVEEGGHKDSVEGEVIREKRYR
jgi:hypothetical protein